jgi:hypothetical protein
MEMTKLENLYHTMLEALKDGIPDLEKFEAGNNSAGTRVRKTMQTVKGLAQDIRTEVQEQKNAVTA